MRTEQRHRVVVVGGGYAGTLCAIRLAGRARHRAHVSLVDADGALIQRLRLHELAAGRDVRAFALPGLAGPGVETIHGRATAIDLRAGRVRVAAGGGDVHLPYDTLVLATGSTVDVDTVPGAARHAHRLADAAAALRLRAALAATPAGAGVAVVGGGMTGLETASELAEARPDLRLRLVTAGRAGGWLSPAGRRHVDAVLRRLGVEVVEDARVAAVEEDRLVLHDRAEAGFDLAVWCGGFVATPLARAAGLATDARGCAVVDATLRSVSHPEVLAVGDAAAVPRQRNGAAIRMACAVAVPLGAHAADVVTAALDGRDPEPFDFGWLAQAIGLGRRDALVQPVDRADVPRGRVLGGRAAVRLKALACSVQAPAMRLERRLPGAVRWTGSGVRDERRPARDAAAAA